jgi:Trypsin-co-occurring domain 1
MTAYVDVPIGSTETITVEISEGGLSPVGARDKIGHVADRFDEALAQVVRMGASAIEKARATAKPPSAIEVELGLKLTAKTGFVVAESSGEANFKVVLKWALGDA